MRLSQPLCRAVRVNPTGRATIDGERVRDYRTLADRVTRLASGLAGLGVNTGDRVAILANNCDTFLELYYAVVWMGAVVVPLNTRLAAKEIAFQLEDAGVRVVCFGREYIPMVAILRQNGPSDRVYVAMDEEGVPGGRDIASLIAASEPMGEVSGSSNDLAGIFYTGGTTGLPKGVMLSHNNLHCMASSLIMALKVDERCVNLHAAPMFHLADIGLFMTTMVAGQHVLTRKLSEDLILDLIARWGITHIFTVPAVIDRLAKHPRAATTELSSLMVLGYGGAPMPMGTYVAARARFPQTDFVQGYGMTEMAASTLLGPECHRPGADPAKLNSVGKVIYGYELRIVDPEGQEVPPGQMGEIVGRGDNVMLGYWNRPAETAAALRDGWMHTQDGGYIDEQGFIYITDRLKDMIITGGENVYSIEVESVLSTHPLVDECAIIGVPDSQWGERVHGIIVPKDKDAVDLESVTAFMRERIAAYKCPKTFEVRRAPLPRNAAGKILKTELRNHYAAQGAPR